MPKFDPSRFPPKIKEESEAEKYIREIMNDPYADMDTEVCPLDNRTRNNRIRLSRDVHEYLSVELADPMERCWVLSSALAREMRHIVGTNERGIAGYVIGQFVGRYVPHIWRDHAEAQNRDDRDFARAMIKGFSDHVPKLKVTIPSVKQAPQPVPNKDTKPRSKAKRQQRGRRT